MASTVSKPFVCARCAANSLPRRLAAPATGHFTASYATKAAAEPETPSEKAAATPLQSDSPLARRLEEATEEALLTGGRAGRRAIEDAGFSEELKERLYAKVKDAQFRSEHAAAFSEAGMPSSTGSATRVTATSRAWTGEEATEDAVLRMLTDAHKPLSRDLRSRPKLPDLQPIDLRMGKSQKLSPGHKVVNARDKASVYAEMSRKELEAGLSEEEREAMRQELRERFKPAARALPNTLTGLTSLANERIEDAIARGQFKNIPRGKGVERDPRSDNPFIDTTEYILNKMIKRQDIVPPWIEKQQELAKASHVFRARLRSDWRRHAARMISSTGGSLEDQMTRARRYAQAEEIHNPRKRNVDQTSVPTNSTDDVVMVKVRQQNDPESPNELDSSISPETSVLTDSPLPPPFRDPDWLSMEKSYMELSINNLNTLARSYNLMAPELAKKPYFSLQRELDNCYADVAPLLAKAIQERATRPAKSLADTLGDKPSSILDRFGNSTRGAKIYDSKAPKYGFKEMWRDLFARETPP
ncbi:hypothetical protein GGR57DRAFT_353285 [Xylariaceae sp. FL1272]|nr:hypothetical protein GGR57DRAFT_353285 [Xylariaceae sp. FL1272]